MGFVNCALEESERRVYRTTRMDKERVFGGGTIDRENDVRLFCYANGPVREQSNFYSFIFDYRGEVLDTEFYKTWLNHDTIEWRMTYSDKELNEKQLKSLREAMKVYAVIGFAGNAKGMERVNSVNVEVKFLGKL